MERGKVAHTGPSAKTERDFLESWAAEKGALLSGERRQRIVIFGEPGNWDATLLVNVVGNAERKARVRSIARELRSEFDLADQRPSHSGRASVALVLPLNVLSTEARSGPK